MIDISQVKIVRLHKSYKFLPFDCADNDLNEFLLKDSKPYLKKLLAVTYIIEYEGCTLAFFSVCNDKISASDCPSNNKFKQLFKDIMPDGKKFRSFPSVKIGRLGVNKNFQGKGFGTSLLDLYKRFVFGQQ